MWTMTSSLAPHCHQPSQSRVAGKAQTLGGLGLAQGDRGGARKALFGGSERCLGCEARSSVVCGSRSCVERQQEEGGRKAGGGQEQVHRVLLHRPQVAVARSNGWNALVAVRVNWLLHFCSEAKRYERRQYTNATKGTRHIYGFSCERCSISRLRAAMLARRSAIILSVLSLASLIR